MKISILTLFASLLFFTAFSPADTAPPRIDPRVAVKLNSLPVWLKPKFAQRTLISTGVAPFGTDEKDVWVVCFQEKKTKTGVLELWEQDIHRAPHLLLRAGFNAREEHPIQNTYGAVRLCWLFPARHAGPVITTLFDQYQMVYTFEKGWDGSRPVTQQVDYISSDSSGNAFDFDSVDERGITQGSVFVVYHMTSEDDIPGADYALWWHRGKGWFASNEKAKPKN